MEMNVDEYSIMKVCNKCRRSININDFSMKTASPDGYSNICKPCVLDQKRVSKWLAFKRYDDISYNRIHEERERLESMTLVDLKSVMKFNHIPIRHLNKPEIIDVLLNTPNVNYEVEYTGALEAQRPAPKLNIRNNARRVKLIDDAGGEIVFSSLYKTSEISRI